MREGGKPLPLAFRYLILRGKQPYSGVSIKNIDILPNRQYIANTADLAQERYS